MASNSSLSSTFKLGRQGGKGRPNLTYLMCGRFMQSTAMPQYDYLDVSNEHMVRANARITSRITAGRRMGYIVPFGARGYLYTDFIGSVLPGLGMSRTSSMTGTTTWSHVWKLDSYANASYVTALHSIGEGSDKYERLITDGRIEQLSLEAGPRGINFAFAGAGLKEEAASGSEYSENETSVMLLPSKGSATIVINNVPMTGALRGMRFMISNPLDKADQSLFQFTHADVRSQGTEIGGGLLQIDVDYNTYKNLEWGGVNGTGPTAGSTSGQITFRYDSAEFIEGTTPYSLQVDIPVAEFRMGQFAASGRNLVRVEVPFLMIDNTADPIVITQTNARNGTYYAGDMLMRDEYITVRSAGAVNTTAAEPGPGTRTVVDAESKLTIASNKLTFAGGKTTPAWGDPAIRYASIARAAGKMTIAQINRTSGNQLAVGFDDNASPGTTVEANALAFAASNVLNALDNGTAIPVGAIANATNYELCTVLRASGAYHFIIGGAHSTWKLLWWSSLNSAANVLPTIANYDAVFTSDHFYHPTAIWLPTPLAYDTFTRSNGALGNSEAVGNDSQTLNQIPWVEQAGTWTVTSNAAKASALAGGIAIATLQTYSASVIAEAKLTRPSAGNVGIIIRYQDASNYIRAYHNGTNAILEKVVAGSPTSVISAAATYGAGNLLRVIADGTAFRLYYNNAQIGTEQTIADVALQAGYKHGIYTTDLTNTIDDLLIFARGAGNEYSVIDTI